MRQLPSGMKSGVFPFHVSFEGLEKNIICRDDEDCDTLVKCIFVCSLRKDVIVIIYAVVSNHAHVAVLAKTFGEAKAFGEEVKRTYSQLFRKRYGETKVLKGTDVCILAVDTLPYLRNVLSYNEDDGTPARPLLRHIQRRCRPPASHPGRKLGFLLFCYICRRKKDRPSRCVTRSPSQDAIGYGSMPWW